MTDPVNLANLREMTGGDAAIERELFAVFMDSSEKCFANLEANAAAGQEEAWRTEAHAWKGMSLNLGAESLGHLCANAQMKNTAPPEEKAKILAEIKDEYEKVKQYLKSVYPTTA